MASYPVEQNVANVECGDYPTVVIGCDTPITAHTSCIGIADVAAINVRNKIEQTKSRQWFI